MRVWRPGADQVAEGDYELIGLPLRLTDADA